MKEELTQKNPIRLLDSEVDGNPVSQRMGLVMARAGLGKTAFLVQIALNSLLKGKQVVHVSIDQSLEKTKLWYDDIFKDIATACQLKNAGEIYDEIMRNRMIMTFKESSFSPAKLAERLNDVVAQGFFKPCCLMIDNYSCSVGNRQVIMELRKLMENMDLQVWLSAVSHRDDERVSGSGVPAPCHEVDDLFDTVILLQAESPQQKGISLNFVKDRTGSVATGKVLSLDPATFLVKEG